MLDIFESVLALGRNPVRRPREQFGDFALSVQAGPGMYCSPQVNGLPIAEYESVEVALCRGPGQDGENCLRPETADMPKRLADLFESIDYPVAGYVSQADLQAMRDHLTDLATR